MRTFEWMKAIEDERCVDYKQIVGEVKERNKFYRAIIEVRELADKGSFCKIKTICDKAIEGVI